MGTLYAFFISRYKAVLVYKVAAVSGVITQTFFAFFRIFTLQAFMTGAILSSPMKQSSMITYIWLNQIFLSIVPWNVNREDLNSIKTGNIAYELARPIKLFSIMYVRTLAWRIASSIVRVIPIAMFNLIILSLFGFEKYSIHVNSVEVFLVFLVSIIFSYLLSCMITVFLYSITLYTIDASNFLEVINSLAFVLSGSVIPLSFFPNWMQGILSIQPFKGIIDTPALILSSQYNFTQSMLYMLLQVIWLVIFFLLNYIMFNKGTSKIVVQGG